jgi:arginase
MPVTVIGAPVGAGAGLGGAEAGPMALRNAGLRQALSAAGHSVQDRGDVKHDPFRHHAHPNPALKALPEVAAWAAAIHASMRDIPIEQIPVVLGGDHSLSLGSVPGLAERAARHGRPFFILWIDAHPDCHSFETSVSGHLHGTPVAYATGRTSHKPLFPTVKFPVLPDNLRMVGIRDIDKAEAIFLRDNGLTAVSPAAYRTAAERVALDSWFEHIRQVNGLLHVSLDADALDPAIAPGVGTPVADGLAFAETQSLLAAIAAADVLGSMDLVEVNPFLDQGQRTARAMVDLAAAALGRQAAATRTRGAIL